MKSPNQARPTSTCKGVSIKGGFKPTSPMCSGRKTPTSKTPAKPTKSPGC